jgi:hypothetical protein
VAAGTRLQATSVAGWIASSVVQCAGQRTVHCIALGIRLESELQLLLLLLQVSCMKSGVTISSALVAAHMPEVANMGEWMAE